MLEGWPFHLTHRGNQRRAVFRSDGDRRLYLRLLARYASKFDMRVWAYCLMPNHVHLIAVGAGRDSIPKAIGNTHRAYSRCLNITQDVTGHLWANRFYSTALDEPHLWAAVRYVELNPVRAGMVAHATDYPWSSARAHANGKGDRLLDPERPFPGPVGDWSGWLATGLEQETAERLRNNTSTGRPTGGDDFIRDLEARLGRPLEKKARVRSPKRQQPRREGA
jgi:putative transposase